MKIEHPISIKLTGKRVGRKIRITQKIVWRETVVTKAWDGVRDYKTVFVGEPRVQTNTVTI